jgi:clan AA aspartic protease (TIGR02281 family)
MRVHLGAVALALLVAAGAGRAEWTGGANTEVPLDGNGATWLVRATLNGNVTGLFLIDTGASLCVVAPGTARRLNAAPSGEETELHTANGVVRAPVIHLRTLDVGGNRARDVPAIVHPAVGPPLDGILGLSYLNNFSYSIDPKRRILRLK